MPAHVADERARPKVVVPDETVPLHPLLQKYDARLRRRGDDLVKRAPVHAIDIDVSRAQLDRALRVMHAVLCALDERHLPVEVVHANGSPIRTTIVMVDGVRLAFGIREERTRILVPVAPPQSRPRVDPDAWRSIKDERTRAQAYAALLLGRREPPAPASSGPTYVDERWEWSGLLTLWIDPMMQLPGAGPRSFAESATRRIDERLSTFVLRSGLSP